MRRRRHGRGGGLAAAVAVALVAGAAGTSHAAIKVYDASERGGTPGDERRASLGLCPPVETTLASLEGAARLADDGLGTVTLLSLEDVSSNRVDVGPESLVALFGPGAFVFLDVAVTRFVALPQTSNASGIGAHGPSGTAPGESVEWGVVSGWQITGTTYCVASPAAVCDENGFAHGVTRTPTLPSSTYDLGTWHFDAEGDYEAASWYIRVTSNGGLSNNQERLRGAFVGASLPALPLVGAAALAVGLLAAAARARRSRRPAG